MHGYATMCNCTRDSSLATLVALRPGHATDGAMCNSCILNQWMTVNNLKLIDSSYELLTIVPKHHHARIMASHPAIKVGDNTVKHTVCARNLGVTFDPTDRQHSEGHALPQGSLLRCSFGCGVRG